VSFSLELGLSIPPRYRRFHSRPKIFSDSKKIVDLLPFETKKLNDESRN
jgi:hypothetical protein